MKSIILPCLICLIMLLMLCCEKETTSDTIVVCVPRSTTQVWLFPGQLVTSTYQGNTFVEKKTNFSDTVKVDELFLAVSTGTTNLLSLFGDEGRFIEFFAPEEEVGASANKTLEQALVDSYESYMKRSQKEGSSSKQKDNVVPIEYRRTGVTAFNLVALDAPLFDIPAGATLNDHVEIVGYFPDYIVDARNELLLYGFGDVEKPTTVQQWLALKPLVQPTLQVKLTGSFPLLPLDTRFAVTLETTEGIILSDTTQTIHLLN